MLLDDDLEMIKQAAEQAPPGPWVGVVGAATTQVFAADGSFVIGADVGRLATHQFVCAVDPSTVLALVTELQQLRSRSANAHRGGSEDAAGDHLSTAPPARPPGPPRRRS